MLTCDQHDYIEIVCTFRYPIKLTMKSGAVIECVALDTARNENSDENMKVDVSGSERWKSCLIAKPTRGYWLFSHSNPRPAVRNFIDWVVAEVAR